MFAPGLMIVCAGMQVELTHLGIAVIMDDLNAISVAPNWPPVDLRFPYGNERLTYFMMKFMSAGWLADQEEMDKFCCETSQRCKQCVSPKNRLHEAHTVFDQRKGKDAEGAVRNAFAGQLLGKAPGQLLFKLGTDPKSKRPRWFPTAACNRQVYEDTRTALNGVHLIDNALWRARHVDYLMQVF